jgi:hypothetical protein
MRRARTTIPAQAPIYQRHIGPHAAWSALMALAMTVFAAAALAQETVCARVKIEIKQELTLERQAFDAEMKISNQLDGSSLTEVSVVVKVTDEQGTPVTITDDPNNLNAKFFIRVSNKENISDVDGTGAVGPSSTATINWLLIPAPGTAGNLPAGKKYLVGATLKYKFGAEAQTLDVSPDVITVKPLPLLTLDYFLTRDVIADDPLTADVIEPAEPFTLGVRVKNNGKATAKNLKIDSAQPKIVKNDQGLLINFKLDGTFVNDAPVQNTLLVNLGDVAPDSSKMGRWIMETTLAGKFTEFTAKFSHADELGGALTSILQATNAHSLIRDVRVDLPGRDLVRDFLAQDVDAIRVYESSGLDSVVTDRSTVAQLSATTGDGYRLVFPSTEGFVYAKVRDPFNGQKVLGAIGRADAKVMLAENVWLSKTINLDTHQFEYWLNIFDVNSPGVYDTAFQAPPATAQPPQIQFIPDRTVNVGKQVSFLVEAASPGGKPVTLTASPLPAGATFVQDPPNPLTPGVARALFDWTPAAGTTGNYLIVYRATDGTLSSTRSASIRVDPAAPAMPGTPTIDSPAAGAQVATLRPTLKVQTSPVALDPTVKVQFELYSDEAMTQLVASALLDKAGAQPTAWALPADLNDNTRYWWRARAFDGVQIYSLWVNASFFVNLFNDAPDNFNLTSPAPNAEVATLQPVLTWTNSADKDGDAISYSVTLYRDAALTDVVASALDLPPGTNGSTSWTVTVALVNHKTYYWKVVAKDALGAMTPSIARPFIVNTTNAAPSAPVILSPAVGGQSTTANTALAIQNSTDADDDPITYVFEIDTVNTFDSGNKRASGPVPQGSGATTSWVATGLVENVRYFWRVKSQDGRAESAWVVGDFLMNAANDAPPVPTIKNPGDNAWSATQQPLLEVNPVQDPEGDAVRYEFEVYTSAALTSRVANGISSTTSFTVPTPLADRTTHWWRARALDSFDAASAWTVPVALFISTGPYQDPTIQVTAPATPLLPETVATAGGPRKQVTLRWTGTDVNIEPTVALYYDTTKAGFAGILIVDNLRQAAAGTLPGSYVWDVTDLAPGAYYVYAVIYDAKAAGRAYAAGAVVVPNPADAGQIVVTAGSSLTTSEDGAQTSFSVRLSKAPVADVVVPVVSTAPTEGAATPASLLFTAQNWAANQTVTVKGQNDCLPDGDKPYQVLSGKAVSLDPNYIGLSGAPVSFTNVENVDQGTSTNNPSINICGMTIASERRLNATTWEYKLNVELTNTGPNVSGVTGTLIQVPTGMTIVDNTSVFGAVNSGETAKTGDTVTVRTTSQFSSSVFKQSVLFKWNVTVQP